MKNRRWENENRFKYWKRAENPKVDNPQRRKQDKWKEGADEIIIRSWEQGKTKKIRRVARSQQIEAGDKPEHTSYLFFVASATSQ